MKMRNKINLFAIASVMMLAVACKKDASVSPDETHLMSRLYTL
jgi:hypothetical protein